MQLVYSPTIFKLTDWWFSIKILPDLVSDACYKNVIFLISDCLPVAAIYTNFLLRTMLIPEQTVATLSGLSHKLYFFPFAIVSIGVFYTNLSLTLCVTVWCLILIWQIVHLNYPLWTAFYNTHCTPKYMYEKQFSLFLSASGKTRMYVPCSFAALLF